MTTPLLLLILRIAGAALLLAFFAAVGWYLWQDLRATRQVMTGQGVSMGKLRVLANTGERPRPDTTYELSPITTLGRHSRNTIVLNDTYVSGEHALLAWRDSQWWLEDLSSRNGTFMDGRPIREETIRSDVTLRLGPDLEARIELAPEEAAEPERPVTEGAAAAAVQEVLEPAESGRKIVCPHCWHTFEEADLLAVARHQELVGDPVLGPEAAQRFLPSRFTPEGHALDALGMPCPDMACPRCHLSIPRDLLEKPPLFLSIIGAPGSGKSYLLATMVWELRSLMPKRFGFGFTDADATCNQLINEYERTLFLAPDDEAWVALEKTEMHGRLYDEVRLNNMRVSLPRPFMFSLTPQRHNPWVDQHEALTQTLVVYDNAGEHFEPGADTAANPGTQHLAHSRGLFFLFDPTKDPRFRARCSSDDPQLRRGARAQRQEMLLKEAFDRIRLHSGPGRGQRYSEPVIVVVTKFDIWRNLLKFPLEAPWRRLKDHPVSVLDTDVVMMTSFAVRRLLADLCPEMVATVEGVAPRVVYVPVSALGHSPSEDPRNAGSGLLVVRPRDIKPVWATTPMLCMLSLLGAMAGTRPGQRGSLPSAENCRRFGDRVEFTVPGTDLRLEAPAPYLGRPMRCPETGKLFWLPALEELGAGAGEGR